MTRKASSVWTDAFDMQKRRGYDDTDATAHASQVALSYIARARAEEELAALGTTHNRGVANG